MAKTTSRPENVTEDSVTEPTQAVQESAAPQEPTQTAQEGAAPQEPSSPKNPTVNFKDGLYLRVGPHKSYQYLTILPDGTEVEILPLPANVTVPGWCLVTALGYVGWVATEFLSIPEAV